MNIHAWAGAAVGGLMLIALCAGCTSPGTSGGPVSESAAPAAGHLTYPIVDTGQAACYDNRQQIPCPAEGRDFSGQDAQNTGNRPDYAVSADGLTVRDGVTGLTWQRSPDTNGDGSLTRADKLTWSQARARPATLDAARFGGFTDWRLPSVKELYSLIDFRGTDPSPTGTSTAGLVPFIDTRYFGFAYGEPAEGDRIIDSQYASATVYAGGGPGGGTKLFGVNFADGRIKGYDLAGPGGAEKTFFVLCVRGNPEYGVNRFTDNGGGTVTDAATGLTWTKADSGTGMDWQDALAWVREKNAAGYLGHDDWRLPDAKELQSIVDYTRSPESSGSPALDPVFSSTGIRNEAGQPDYPYYWTGTTHASANGAGGAAVYIAFGEAPGYIGGAWRDVHGAGSQRSDPKAGDPSEYPRGRGPQGDAIRIDNFVRLVR
ncbi:MAG TPA: DUF1566 domain-containing protein [Methanomicrobiales archaeon]|nr:DUF1566 domain-containing protein [Methanomicrobiales archaeon]